MSSALWPVVTGLVPLAEDEIHVWRINLDIKAESAQPLCGLLSEVERTRANRFVLEMHRRTWTVARASLRTVLAQYVGASPESLHFSEGKHGKPALELDTELQFNLSHSGSMGLIAVTRERPVGVDIEQIRADIKLDPLIHSVFSPWEQGEFDRLPEALRADGFFNCWSRKEAFIKAVGEGISFGLARFDVTLAPGEPARLLRVDREGFRVEDWSLQAIDVGPCYKAAVAAWGAWWSVRCMEFGGS